MYLDRSNLTNVLLAAILVAAILAFTNPIIMEGVSDITTRSILVLLRYLDKLAVDYQLMRGTWKDATSSDGPIESA